MRLHLGTRKGYLAFCRVTRGNWRVERSAFIGDPVTQILPDPRDGRLIAALNLGHFGVKLRTSDDGGASFREVAAPAYPRSSSQTEDAPSVDLLWCLEPAGPEPGTLWCGTIPGGCSVPTTAALPGP